MADEKKQGYDLTQFDKIKKRDDQIKQDFGERDKLNKAYASMYWMDDGDRPGNKGLDRTAWDENDIRETRSTSSRDSVGGLHRMLKTSKPRFEVDCDKRYKDKIEEALGKWWEASCMVGLARLESEMALSAILFAEPGLSVDLVEDIKAYAPEYEADRLDEIMQETPFLFEAVPGQTSYPVYGRFGLAEHLTEYTEKGKALKDRWRVEGLDDTKDYTVRDHFDMEWRCVYLVNGPNKEPLEMGKHGLKRIPKFVAVADGTNQFPEQHRKRQGFLYGIYRGGLDLRENETLTALFTSIAVRGVGPIYFVDKDSLPSDGAIDVKMQGAFRYVVGKGQMFDDKAADAVLLSVLQRLDEMSQRGTINAQTLGENIKAGNTFSGYAMAAQNGRVPLIPITEAVEKVIHDAMVHALRRFKDEAIEWEGLKPTDIPDNFKASQLTVKLEVDLPQDELRDAQILQTLQNIPLSNEWKHSKLKIGDSAKMTFDWMSDKALEKASEIDMPNLVQQMMQTFQLKPPAGPGPQGLPPDGMPSEGAMPPVDGMNPAMPGGPDAALAGAMAMPATEPNTEMQRGVA